MSFDANGDRPGYSGKEKKNQIMHVHIHQLSYVLLLIFLQ